jgi:AbrB family looped-hinge helix DNA binding protein
MENIDFTRLSSKGQIVVPRRIRERLHLADGEIFLIFGSNDTLVLKRVQEPSSAEFKKILTRARKLAKEKGLKPKDMDKAITDARNAARR